LSIKIFYDKINFRLHGTGEIKRFLEKVIIEENKVPGDLNFIFTDYKSIIEINREFIGHNYFTDVISFDYSENNLLQGEVYISVDTINENSRRFDVPRYEEVVRVMIHGVLHLCGYQDDTEENRKVMHVIQELRIKQFLGK
jgi:rRNA maturation RNase YbeY